VIFLLTVTLGSSLCLLMPTLLSICAMAASTAPAAVPDRRWERLDCYLPCSFLSTFWAITEHLHFVLARNCTYGRDASGRACILCRHARCIIQCVCTGCSACGSHKAFCLLLCLLPALAFAAWSAAREAPSATTLEVFLPDLQEGYVCCLIAHRSAVQTFLWVILWAGYIHFYHLPALLQNGMT
jgi:hypothetical protein